MSKKQTRAERKEQAIRTAARHLAAVPYPVETLQHIFAALECFPYLSDRKSGEERRLTNLRRIMAHTDEMNYILAHTLVAVAQEREIAAEEQKRQRGGYYLELESCSGCIDRTEINAMLNSIGGIERK